MDGSDATGFITRDALWRTRLLPIGIAAEITAHIKILPVHQPYLYQKLSKKATQLRLLEMSYQQIAKSLNINKKTAMKACKYKRRWLYVLAIQHPIHHCRKPATDRLRTFIFAAHRCPNLYSNFHLCNGFLSLAFLEFVLLRRIHKSGVDILLVAVLAALSLHWKD